MNDEIKEILDRLERIDHKEYSCDFEFADSATFDEMARCFEERKKMADYIINLQEENKSLRTRIKTIKRLRKKQTAKKNKYKSIIFNEEKALHDYKSRCEKTIEYIKDFRTEDYILVGKNSLLNILQKGSDSQ